MLKKTLVLAVSIFILNACLVHSTVSRYGNLSNNTTGGTYFILPSDEQQASAEFDHYGNKVAAKLNGLGYRRTESFSGADYAVMIDYGVNGSSLKTSTTPTYGQTGGGTTFYNGSSSYGNYSGTTYTSPTYGVTGYSTSTTRHYQRFLRLNFYDVKKSTDDNIVSAYEINVISSGSSETFAQVSGCLLDSAFINFYKIGTEKVEYPINSCGTQ